MSETKIADSNFTTGAVRSADVAHLDFCSAPLLGLLGMLRVAGGGGTKYGRFNYMLGMTQHETLNHVAVHLIRYILGDRTEPHLEKVAWGALVAAQNEVLKPELCSPHMLGPGATLTAAMLAELERGREERDAKRQAGEFEALFNWTLGDMPEVQAILGQRQSPPFVHIKDVSDEDKRALKQAILESSPGPLVFAPERRSNCQYNIVTGYCDQCGVTSLAIQSGAKCPMHPGNALEAATGPRGQVYVDPQGSHPVDHAFRSLHIKGRGDVDVDDSGFIVLPETKVVQHKAIGNPEPWERDWPESDTE